MLRLLQAAFVIMADLGYYIGGRIVGHSPASDLEFTHVLRNPFLGASGTRYLRHLRFGRAALGRQDAIMHVLERGESYWDPDECKSDRADPQRDSHTRELANKARYRCAYRQHTCKEEPHGRVHAIEHAIGGG